MSEMKIKENEPIMEAGEFQLDISTDYTGNNSFRISPKEKKSEVEWDHSGKTRWITQGRLPLTRTIVRAIPSFTITEHYFIASEEERISFLVNGLDEKLISKDEGINDFKKSLLLLRSKGLLKNKDDFNEIMEQQKLLRKKRKTLSKYQGKVVVACGGELFIGNTLDEAVQKARKKYKDKPFYSESIGMVDIPSVYEL